MNSPSLGYLRLRETGTERFLFFRTFRGRAGGEFARSGRVEERFFAISSDVTVRQPRL